MNRLDEVLEIMKQYEEKGYDVYFEGRGDGTVQAIIEATFIVDNKKKKIKRNDLLPNI